MTEAGEIEAPRYERALGGLGLGTAVVAATTTTTTTTDDRSHAATRATTATTRVRSFARASESLRSEGRGAFGVARWR
jgi:hypothetical protein